MKKRTDVRWSARARDDLLSIGRFIAADNPPAARLWVEKLRLRTHAAARSPLAGRRVPELDREDIREVLMRSHRIVYRATKGGIEVITVFEGHRLLPEDLDVSGDDENR
jgi:toxin ParE1/3/4